MVEPMPAYMHIDNIRDLSIRVYYRFTELVLCQSQCHVIFRISEQHFRICGVATSLIAKSTDAHAGCLSRNSVKSTSMLGGV